MTASELLRKVGEALFGADWRVNDLAGAIDINHRTLRRWLAATEEPSPGVWRDLHALAVVRAAQLAALVPHLEERGRAECVSWGKR